jgi:multiple sugar transport system permease protein/raffinose/stachyose/melibiose transport system permease protein
MKRFFQNKVAIIAFTLPTLILFTTFVVYPIVPLVITSLQEHDGVSVLGFVGLGNYKEILALPRLVKANLNSIYITAASLLLGIPYSLGLALVLHYARLKHAQIYKIMYFLPVVISIPVVCQAWLAILNPDWGLLNSLLRALRLGSLTTPWLTNVYTVIPCIIIVLFWQYLGFNMTVFYAGLMTIPDQYFEAALIDGASKFQSSIKIAVPLLSNVIKFIALTSIIGCMKTFAHVQILTQGGPGDASYTLVYMVYNFSFVRNRFGAGSAISILFVLECLVFAIFLNRYAAREKIEF